MAKRTRTVKDPVQKGRITIGEARTAARTVREKRAARSALSGRYVTSKPSRKK